jgi:nicotinamide riboside kinase
MAADQKTRKSVYIIGPQSTGKTTLVNYLEQSYERGNTKETSRPAIVREVARTVLQERHFTRNDLMQSPERALLMQQYIMQAQHQAERAATAQAPSSWYISDRSGLDCIVYARLYAGEQGASSLLASPEWAELEQKMKAGIVFLCEAGCRWLVDDGTRLMPQNNEEWMRVDAGFREILDTKGISYTLVPKTMESLQERLQLVQSKLVTAEA